MLNELNYLIMSDRINSAALAKVRNRNPIETQSFVYFSSLTYGETMKLIIYQSLFFHFMNENVKIFARYFTDERAKPPEIEYFARSLRQC